MSHNFDSPELFIGYTNSAEVKAGERYLINNVSKEKIIIQQFAGDKWEFVWDSIGVVK